MSVGLGDIPEDGDTPLVEVTANEYDGETLQIEQVGEIVILTRRQLQELSKIIDRFMDR